MLASFPRKSVRATCRTCGCGRQLDNHYLRGKEQRPRAVVAAEAKGVHLFECDDGWMPAGRVEERQAERGSLSLEDPQDNEAKFHGEAHSILLRAPRGQHLCKLWQ